MTEKFPAAFLTGSQLNAVEKSPHTYCPEAPVDSQRICDREGSARFTDKVVPAVTQGRRDSREDIKRDWLRENFCSSEITETKEKVMAALSESMVTKEAEALHKAAQLKSTLPPLTARYPEIDPDGAYRIQLAWVRLKEKEGQKIVGKKIGLTSKAMQRMLSVDEPDYGHIFNGMLVEDGHSVHTDELIQPKVEPEIAFILDRDLRGPGVTALDVLAATRFVVPALEIIDSRIESWKIKLCDTIADNASSGRVVLGSTPRSVDQINLRLVGMVLERNGEVVQTGAGAAVLGNPANAVAWLANAVGRFGVELKAGEIVMPGALTAAVDVSCGDVFQASFDGLGSVSVRFV